MQNPPARNVFANKPPFKLSTTFKKLKSCIHEASRRLWLKVIAFLTKFKWAWGKSLEESKSSAKENTSTVEV